MNPFANDNNFESLSLKDLLDARDLFHFHLMSKADVVATAVGLYRIRKDSPWPSKEHPKTSHTLDHKKERRTLFNSEIRPYSWPCVYVFVSNWESQTDNSPMNMMRIVPKTLWMPDGRSVPVCVIEARKELQEEKKEINIYSNSPTNFYGPGSPIINEDAQGVERLGTAGCIVRDGQKYYAITNNHVLGACKSEIKAYRGNKCNPIGFTSKKFLTRKLIHEVYPTYEYTNQYLQMDIGLIELNNILDWKADAFSLQGDVGSVVDLYDKNFSLKLIGQKVSGHGALSGKVEGEIQGLFYRYKSLAGYEYISDFLIGPSTGKETGHVKEKTGQNISLNIQHGDSGMLLFLEEKPGSNDAHNGNGHTKQTIYFPLAILWGKNEFIDDDRSQARPYGLATSLSMVLGELELDFVKNLNYDNPYTWGYVGHYAIANKLSVAVDLLGNSELSKFVKENESLLSIPEELLSGKKLPESPKAIIDGKVSFVPLADVPDNVWKGNVNKVKGADGKMHAGPGVRNSPEDNPNHFADIDLPNPKRSNKTLLDYSIDDPKNNFQPAVWVDFFTELHPVYDKWYSLLKGKETRDPKNHWGALPFRIWQIFDKMVEFAKAGDATSFLCAGGIIAHYIGDACQPLHTSYMSNGDPSRVVKGPKGNQIAADGVHEGYEAHMVNRDVNRQQIMNQLIPAIQKQHGDHKEKIQPIKTGFDAGVAALQLIKTTITQIKPADIIREWEVVEAESGPTQDQKMWEKFGTDTIEVMARGVRYLAAVWSAAWQTSGSKIHPGTGVKNKDLIKLYMIPDFLPSIKLPDYQALFNLPGNHSPQSSAGKKKKKSSTQPVTLKKAARKKRVLPLQSIAAKHPR